MICVVFVHQEAVAAEQKSLGGQAEALLSWLTETEARMNGGMEKMEGDDSCDQLTQQLSLCKASALVSGLRRR